MVLPPIPLPVKLIPTKIIGKTLCFNYDPMTTATIPNNNSNLPRPKNSTRYMLLATVWIIVITISACLFQIGVRLRHWAWMETENMHFQNDVTHAYQWGSDPDHVGLFNRYRQIRADFGDQPPLNVGLDYAPLRLTIVTFWAQWVNRHFDPEDQWDPAKSYAFHRPLLIANATCEFAAAIGVVLVLRLMRQISLPEAKSQSGFARTAREYLPLAIAGLLLWFNPAPILNDCWPQWDAWILPSFIFALYFSMRGWWFTAGVLLGIGAMLKGQILFVAPVFLLWPLFSAQWLSLARIVAGFAVAFTLIAAPWALTTRGDWVFVSAGVILALFNLIYLKGWTRPLFQLLAAAALVGPVWLTPVILHGDLSWFVLPYQYGLLKHPEIGAIGTSNLSTLLHEQWGWEADGPDGTVDIPLPSGHTLEMTLRMFLAILYALCLTASGIAAALQWRRRHPRFLLAMYSPWILFFALLPHLNNRYLLWASCFFPLIMPLGLGMTLLGGLISLACCAMLIEIMCRFNNNSDPTLGSISHGMYPGLAYLVLLIAAIFLYSSLILSRKPDQAH